MMIMIFMITSELESNDQYSFISNAMYFLGGCHRGRRKCAFTESHHPDPIQG